MNKKQYLKVIETIIKSPRSDDQKIDRLQEAFMLYHREIINALESKQNELFNARNKLSLKMYSDKEAYNEAQILQQKELGFYEAAKIIRGEL